MRVEKYIEKRPENTNQGIKSKKFTEKKMERKRRERKKTGTTNYIYLNVPIQCF
jgi:hypothetical protein